MLEINQIRSNPERIFEGLAKRNYSQEIKNLVNQIIIDDNDRKRLQTSIDQNLSKINVLSKEIGQLYKVGKHVEADLLKREVAELKEENAQLEQQHSLILDRIEESLLKIPNIPHSSVPFGKGPEDNELYREGCIDIPSLPEGALPHWDLAEKYNIFSLKRGALLTGSGFPVFMGKGAKLQRALISFFLDEAIKAGYREVIPPLLVNKDTARGTGQLPDKEGQMYHIEKDELYLIPTAEVPLTNLYRNSILSLSELPIKLTAYTPCFRREAGSYGTDVKGLNRVHQFDKVEIVQIVHPDTSYEVLEEMVVYVESLLIKLQLPYRILRLCGGDMGFTSALTYDFEVYSAAQGRWLEVSSVSCFESFQSHRMMMRFKDVDGKNKLVHTLNGSALALARIVAAILENNQTSEGIAIPKVLKPYTRFEIIN